MSESRQQKTPAEEVKDTTKQKSGPRAGVDGTSSTRTPQTAKKPFARQAATASWLAPVLSLALSYCTKQVDQAGSIFMLTIEVLFIVAGLVFGIIALFGIRKHGREGIFKPAIAGIIVSVSLILLIISLLVLGYVADKRRLRQEGEQMAINLLLNEPGWIGFTILPDTTITVVSMHDGSDAARELNACFGANVSSLIIGIFNLGGKETLTVDPSLVRLVLTDDTIEPALPIRAVLQTAREQKWIDTYSGPFKVLPGEQLTRCFVFIPHGFDMSKVVKVLVNINGQDMPVAGSYLTAEQKAKLIKSGIERWEQIRSLNQLHSHLSETRDEDILVPVANNVLLVNVGVETDGGLFEPIITVGSELPLSKQEIFSTAVDYQETIDVHVLQGFRPLAKYNKTLAKFQITELPRAPRGVPNIVITLQIDQNGRMKIQAVEEATGKDAVILVAATGTLTRSDVETMQKEALQFAKQDEEEATLIKMRNEAEFLLYMAQSVLDGKPPVSKTDRKHLMRLMADVRNHITDPRPEKLTTSTYALQNQLETVIQKMDVP